MNKLNHLFTAAILFLSADLYSPLSEEQMQAILRIHTEKDDFVFLPIGHPDRIRFAAEIQQLHRQIIHLEPQSPEEAERISLFNQSMAYFFPQLVEFTRAHADLSVTTDHYDHFDAPLAPRAASATARSSYGPTLASAPVRFMHFEGFGPMMEHDPLERPEASTRMTTDVRTRRGPFHFVRRTNPDQIRVPLGRERGNLSQKRERGAESSDKEDSSPEPKTGNYQSTERAEEAKRRRRAVAKSRERSVPAAAAAMVSDPNQMDI